MMDVMDKNMDVRAVMSYYAKTKQDSQKELLNNFNNIKLQQMKQKNSIPATKTKKKTESGVFVTGGMHRGQIKTYISRLKQKINEILMGDGDNNDKITRANLLHTKINDLERIMAKQIHQENERRTKKRKKIKDRVYLTKDDLTLNGDDSSVNNTAMTGDQCIGRNFDISSDPGNISEDGVFDADGALDLEV